MAIIIRVGKCTEDPRKLDKRSNFESNTPIEISADLKDNCSLANPAFALTASLVDLQSYNYIHVPSWARYYFINDIITMPGSRVTIRCNVDVLTSNADEILGLTAIVIRSENLKSTMLPNNNYHVQSNRQCETIKFNRTPFTANYATDSIYLLTVLGGAHSSI